MLQAQAALRLRTAMTLQAVFSQHWLYLRVQLLLQQNVVRGAHHYIQSAECKSYREIKYSRTHNAFAEWSCVVSTFAGFFCNSGSQALPRNLRSCRLCLPNCRLIDICGRQSLQDSVFPGRSLGTSVQEGGSKRTSNYTTKCK